MININNYEIWFLDYLEDNLSSDQISFLNEFLSQYPDLKVELDEMSIIQLPENVSNFSNKENLKQTLSGSFDLDDMLIADMEGDLTSEEKHDLELFKSKGSDIEYNEKILNSTQIIDPETISYADKDKLRKDKYNLEEAEDLILAYMDGTISSNDKIWLASHYSKLGLKKQVEQFEKVKLSADTSIVYPDKDGLKRKEAKRVALFNTRFIMRIAAGFIILMMAFQFWNNMDSNIGSEVVGLTNGDIYSNSDKTVSLLDQPLPSKHPLAIESNTVLEQNPHLNIGNEDDVVYNKHNESSVIDDNIIETVNTLVNNYNSKHSIEDLSGSVGIMEAASEELFNDELNTVAEDRHMEVGVVETLNLIGGQHLMSDEDHFLYFNKNKPKLKEESIKIEDGILNYALLNINKDENSENKYSIGAFDIEVPEYLMASVEAIKHSKEKYDEHKSSGRNVLDFKIGNFSFYRSIREED